MKRVFCMQVIAAVIFCCLGSANATDYLLINQDLTGDGATDQVKLTDEVSEFYTLRVISKGKEILRNPNLVPKSMKNDGGLEVFQGVSVVDQNISLRYRFCSPSMGVCYDRNLIGGFKEGQLFFLREETVTSAEKIALSGIFYSQSEVLMESLSYQSLLEDSDNAEKLFSSTYGSCVADLGGDSLARISEELEKDTPNDWVLAKGCITPALVFNLNAQGYLSTAALGRYLALLHD